MAIRRGLALRRRSHVMEESLTWFGSLPLSPWTNVRREMPTAGVTALHVASRSGAISTTHACQESTKPGLVSATATNVRAWDRSTQAVGTGENRTSRSARAWTPVTVSDWPFHCRSRIYVLTSPSTRRTFLAPRSTLVEGRSRWLAVHGSEWRWQGLCRCCAPCRRSRRPHR